MGNFLPFAIAAILGLSVIFTQWLHGGFYVVALSWPLFFGVCVAAMLAAGELFRAGRVPRAWLPAVILGVLAIYGYGRWIWEGQSARGFLPITNLIVGALAFAAVIGGVKGTPARVFLALLLVFAGGLQALQMGLWRAFGSGIELPWFSEQLRAWYQAEWNPRMSGSYMSRNNAVWSINAACLLSAACCIWARWPAYAKFLCGWLAILLAIASIFTFSRGGMIALAVGLAVFLGLCLWGMIRGSGRFRVPLLVLVGILLAGILGVGGWFFTTNSMVQERVERVGEDAYRSEAWKPVYRQIQMEPMWGTGPGSTAHWMRILHSTNLGGTESIYAHNDWLELTAEGGVFALTLVVAALLLVFGVAIRGVDSRLAAKSEWSIPQSTEAALGIGSISCLAAFAVHSFFDYNMQLPPNSLMAFLQLGIAAGTLSPQHAADESERAFPRFSTSLSASVVFIGAGLALFVTYPNFTAEFRAAQMENAIQKNRADLALEIARKASLTDSRNANLHTSIANSWLAAANRFLVLNFEAYPKARLHRKWAVENMPQDRFLLCLQAETFRRIGLNDEARAAVLKAISYSLMLPMAYEIAGGIEEAALDFSRAARFYRLAAGMPNNYRFAAQRYGFLIESLKKNNLPEPPLWLPAPEQSQSQ